MYIPVQRGRPCTATTFLRRRQRRQGARGGRRFNVEGVLLRDADARDGRRRRVVPPLGGGLPAASGHPAAAASRPSCASRAAPPRAALLRPRDARRQTLLLTGRRAARGAPAPSSPGAAAPVDDHAVLFVGVMEHWAMGGALLPLHGRRAARPGGCSTSTRARARAAADVAAGARPRRCRRGRARRRGAAADPRTSAREAARAASRASCANTRVRLRLRAARGRRRARRPGEDNSTVTGADSAPWPRESWARRASEGGRRAAAARSRPPRASNRIAFASFWRSNANDRWPFLVT